VKRVRTWAISATLLALSALEPAHAQTAVRRLTTIDALRRFSGYFHLQNVILRGEFAEAGTRVVLRGGDSEMQVMLNDAPQTDGPVEVRALFIDVGRLTPADPRLARYQNLPDQEHWPMPGEDLVLSVTNVIKTDPVTAPTIRGLALEPWRFDGQSVTVTGQFGGRNLFGDLPAAPAKSRFDFVLKDTDSAVWVTGLRPKGTGFDLNVDARVDTSRWVKVTGVAKRERGMVTIEAKTIVLASAPATRAAPEPAPEQPKEPGEVVFSSPTDGETGVASTAPIRVQFSRGIDPPTLTGHLRIGYLGGAAPADAPAIDAKTSYDVGTHAVEIRLSMPLEPYKTVKVELLDGVKTFDGAPIKPWSVTFSVGAN